MLEYLVDIPESLPLAGSQDPERMQASLVLPAHGDFEAFIGFVRLAQTDWRDALVGSGLGNNDWPALLDYELGRR